MSLFQWSDSPSGAVQDHEIIEPFRQAVADSAFVKYCMPVNVSGGESFSIPIMSDLDEPTSAALNENLTIPLDSLSITSKSVALVEYGRGVRIARKALNRYKDIADVLSVHREELAKQQRLVLDSLAAAAFKLAEVKYVGTGAADSTITTNGTAGAAAVSNLNVFHARAIRDYLRRTLLAPPRANGLYKGLFSTAGLRAMSDDSEFIQYHSNQSTSELEAAIMRGRVAGIEFEEVVHDNALDDDIGTNSDVGEGVVFGDKSVYMGIIEAPRIYYEMKDKERFLELAWHGDFGFGTSTDSGSAGYARIIHVTST